MNRVVARFRDGRILKGTTLDLDPDKPFFHVRLAAGGKAEEVRLGDLKAVFFVRTFEGDAARNEDLAPDPEDPRARGATLLSLTFEDGEVVTGLTIHYPPTRPYFYLVPTDSDSNNIRVLVNRAALAAMQPVS